MTFQHVSRRVKSRFLWQANYLCDVFRRCVAFFVVRATLWRPPMSFRMAAQHFRRVVLRVFLRIALSGLRDVVTLTTPHSTLYTSHFQLSTLHSTLSSLHSTLYTLHSTLHTLHPTLHTPHSTTYTLHPTLYTPHFTLDTLQSTLYNFNSTLYNPHLILHT